MARHLISTSITKLLGRHHLLSAPQLVEHLHSQGQTVNKTSVYRALERLETDGVVCKHNLTGNDLVYELRHHHHDHLICTNCGQIQTVECQINIPEAVKDFVVDHHHVSLFGRCAKCQSHHA